MRAIRTIMEKSNKEATVQTWAQLCDSKNLPPPSAWLKEAFSPKLKLCYFCLRWGFWKCVCWNCSTMFNNTLNNKQTNRFNQPSPARLKVSVLPGRPLGSLGYVSVWFPLNVLIISYYLILIICYFLDYPCIIRVYISLNQIKLEEVP